MASVMLERTSDMLEKVCIARFGNSDEGSGNTDLRVRVLQFKLLSLQLRLALESGGLINYRPFGKMYCYEVDGFGSSLLMDDANVPNLLSLPYLGYCAASNEAYQNTRKFILSDNNPYFHSGEAGSGVGGPHIGLGWIWPLGIITQAITSTDDAEILTCLQTLKNSSANTGFLHEAFWKDNPAKFTRHWFAWANTFFGELILHLAQTRPHLLQQPLA